MQGVDEKARAALKAFMDANGLKPHPWASKAGLRSSTLYNYMSGRSKSLSSDTLQRLAKAAGVTIDTLLSGTPKKAAPAVAPPTVVKGATRPAGGVAVAWRVGVYGRLFAMDTETMVERPVGVPAGVKVTAARVDGDGLHPVPSDWHVYFEEEARSPDALIGKLCVVRVRGAQQPMIREIRRGETAGLYTLLSWGAAPLEGVEVVEAHLILSISQS